MYLQYCTVLNEHAVQYRKLRASRQHEHRRADLGALLSGSDEQSWSYCSLLNDRLDRLRLPHCLPHLVKLDCAGPLHGMKVYLRRSISQGFI